MPPFSTMRNLVLIDKNNLGRRSNAQSVLKTSSGFQTQAVFGFIRTLISLKKEYRDRDFIVLDDGRADFRFNLYPAYKGNRKPLTLAKQAELNAYTAQKPFIDQAVYLLGIARLCASNYEADDLAGLLCSKRGNREVTLVSGDKDWLLLIDKGVEWFDPKTKVHINHLNFQGKTGVFTPEQFLFKKCLMGDTSDNINGVGGIGEERATDMALHYSNFNNFLLNKPRNRYEQALFDSKEKQETFKRNLLLMNIRNPQIDTSKTYMSKGTFEGDAFYKLCENLEFNSFLAHFDIFETLFSKGN